MTQKEKIREEIGQRIDGNYGSHIEGYDIKNPKETNGKELLYVANQTADRTKKEVINKFCEWFEDVDFEMTYIDSEGLFDKEQFINDSRKAMEE